MRNSLILALITKRFWTDWIKLSIPSKSLRDYRSLRASWKSTTIVITIKSISICKLTIGQHRRFTESANQFKTRGKDRGSSNHPIQRVLTFTSTSQKLNSSKSCLSTISWRANNQIQAIRTMSQLVFLQSHKLREVRKLSRSQLLTHTTTSLTTRRHHATSATNSTTSADDTR